MLIEFKVANFRSIHEEQTLSMVASDYSDELADNLIAADGAGVKKGTRLVKAVVLYGANASGKSNIVGALRFLAEFVRDSATKLRPDEPIATEPFWLDPDTRGQSSRFEITAVIGGIRVLYVLELNFAQVLHEALIAYPNGKAQMWFERKFQQETSNYSWSTVNPRFLYDAGLHDATRYNATFLSVAAQFNQPQAVRLWEWFASRLSFLDLAEQYPSQDVALRWIRTDEGARRMNQIMAHADVGLERVGLQRTDKAFLERFRALRQQGETAKKVRVNTLLKQIADTPLDPDEEAEPVFYHTGPDGTAMALNFNNAESAGTKRFFALAGIWLRTMQTGGVLVLDEIETSLHPLLLTALLRTFLSAENAGTAQLIFTTHNPLLLDQTLLRRDQIWLTEKDRGGATRLYPLTDFQPRKDESLLRGYLAGRYGGVPFIPEGLKF